MMKLTSGKYWLLNKHHLGVQKKKSRHQEPYTAGYLLVICCITMENQNFCSYNDVYIYIIHIYIIYYILYIIYYILYIYIIYYIIYITLYILYS